MNPERRGHWVTGLLLGAWLLVVAWQVEEHQRVVAAAQSDLRGSSHEIARTLGAVTRALRFRGALFQDRLEPVLNELVKIRTNALVKSSGLLAIGLLNTEGDPVVSAGDTNLLARETLGESERWSDTSVTFVLPVEGASVNPEDTNNNATVVIPPFHDFPRRGPRPDGTNGPGPFRPPISRVRSPTPAVKWNRRRRPMAATARPMAATIRPTSATVRAAAFTGRRGCAG